MDDLMLRRRMMAQKTDYLDEYSAPWLVKGGDGTYLQYNFSNSTDAVNYPGNISDVPDSLYAIAARATEEPMQNVNIGATPYHFARFCTRDSGWTNKFYPLLEDYGVLGVDGLYYYYLHLTGTKITSAVQDFTEDILAGRISRNDNPLGGIGLWRSFACLDFWLIESDAINADIIRRLKPHAV